MARDQQVLLCVLQHHLLRSLHFCTEQIPLRCSWVPGNWEAAPSWRRKRSKSCSASRDAHALKEELSPSQPELRPAAQTAPWALTAQMLTQEDFQPRHTHSAVPKSLHTQSTLQNTKHSHCIRAPADPELGSKHDAV